MLEGAKPVHTEGACHLRKGGGRPRNKVAPAHAAWLEAHSCATGARCKTAVRTAGRRGEARSWQASPHPCQPTQRKPRVLLQELQAPQVEAHQAQQQLARQAQRQGGLRVDDRVCGAGCHSGRRQGQMSRAVVMVPRSGPPRGDALHSRWRCKKAWEPVLPQRATHLSSQPVVRRQRCCTALHLYHSPTAAGRLQLKTSLRFRPRWLHDASQQVPSGPLRDRICAE